MLYMAKRKRRTTGRSTKAKGTRTKLRTKAGKKAKGSKTKSRTSSRTSAKVKIVKPGPLGKISSPFTKSQLYRTLCERTALNRTQVSAVFDELGNIIAGHLKGGPQKFTLPGVLKMSVKRIPARKARKGINPFTGEPTIFKAKPASKRVKVIPLKALKDMVG